MLQQLLHPIQALNTYREHRTLMRERKAFVEMLADSQAGKAMLMALTGRKELSGPVVQEVIGGRAWFEGLPLSKLGDFNSYLDAGCKRVWVLHACAELIANEVVAAPWKLKLVKDGQPDREWTGTGTQEIKDLLATPNAWLTWETLTAQTILRLVMTGNDFWLKDESTSNGNRPNRLIPMNPKRISIVITTSGELVGYIYRPVYAQDRASFAMGIPLDPQEVIHFRSPNPNNDYFGLGPIEAAEPLFNDFINESTWRESYWQRGALPTTLIIGGSTPNKLTGDTPAEYPGGKEAWDAFKAKWQSDYGGTHNAGKTALIYGDWKTQTIGLSLDEMQSLELSQWTVDRIAMTFHIPLSVLGKDSAANYATDQIASRRFKQHAVLPYVRQFDTQLTKNLVSGYREDAKFEHEIIGLISLEELVPPIAQAISCALLTPNEGRELLGKPKSDDENMDRHYMTAGLSPLELNGVADMGAAEESARAIESRVSSGEAFKPKPKLPAKEPKQLPEPKRPQKPEKE